MEIKTILNNGQQLHKTVATAQPKYLPGFNWSSYSDEKSQQMSYTYIYDSGKNIYTPKCENVNRQEINTWNGDNHKHYVKPMFNERIRQDSENKLMLHEKYSKANIRRRRIIKGAAITAWILCAPLMLCLNFVRETNHFDDENDKNDDPLRPWNYDTKYVQPHER